MNPHHSTLDQWLDEEIARMYVRRVVARDRRIEHWFLGVMFLFCSLYLAWCAATDSDRATPPRHRPSAAAAMANNAVP